MIWGAFEFVQKSHPSHRQGHATEVFFHLAFEDIGAHLVQHITKLIVCLWKKHGLIKAGGILKGDEFHGIPILSMHGFTGHEPADGGHLFPDMAVEVFGFHIVQASQEVIISDKGMEGDEKAKAFELVLEHEVFGIGMLFKVRE